MKTVCTLLVPGVDIPGTMYRAITATTSLALRVIFMKPLRNLLVYMHMHSMMLPCWLIFFLNCWSLGFIRSKLGRKHQFCFVNEWVRSSGDYFQVVRLRSNKKQTEVINIRVVMMAPVSSNQSERSILSLDQSESRISPMWLLWRHIHCFSPRDPME